MCFVSSLLISTHKRTPHSYNTPVNQRVKKKKPSSPLIAHYSLLIINHLLLITYYSQRTSHNVQFTAHNSPFITHYSLLDFWLWLLTVAYSLPNTHYPLFSTHNSLLTIHFSTNNSQPTIHYTFFTTHHSLPTTHYTNYSSLTLILTSCYLLLTINNSPFTTHQLITHSQRGQRASSSTNKSISISMWPDESQVFPFPVACVSFLHCSASFRYHKRTPYSYNTSPINVWKKKKLTTHPTASYSLFSTCNFLFNTK